MLGRADYFVPKSVPRTAAPNRANPRVGYSNRFSKGLFLQWFRQTCTIGGSEERPRPSTPPLSASQSRVVSLCLQYKPEPATLDFVFGALAQRCPQAAKPARWQLGIERMPSSFVPSLFCSNELSP